MKDYIAITSHREFHVEANSMEHACHQAANVLTESEELIILCDAGKTMADYSAGLVKAQRTANTK